MAVEVVVAMELEVLQVVVRAILLVRFRLPLVKPLVRTLVAEAEAATIVLADRMRVVVVVAADIQASTATLRHFSLPLVVVAEAERASRPLVALVVVAVVRVA